MTEYEVEKMKYAVGSSILGLDVKGIYFDDVIKDELADNFDDFLDGETSNITDCFVGNRLRELSDKCKELFAERIADAVEVALSLAQEALREQIDAIEEELFDLIDAEAEGDNQELGA